MKSTQSHLCTLAAHALLAPALLFGALSCNKMNLPGGDKLGGSECRDLATVDAIAKIDFEGKYKVTADAAAKLESSLMVAASLRGISAQVESELAGSCSALAADLGVPGSYKTAKAACDAAGRAMTQARVKMSAQAKIYVKYTPPRCSASLDAMAECTAKCQADVQPGEVKVTCEGGELSGTCEGQCSGRCEVEAGAVCKGTCKGACTADFSGKCDGACNGKCDGKNSEGHCAGKCTGSCDLVASGSCKGECKGSCELKGKAECNGTCSGKCSVEFKAPRCSGECTPPKASAECKGGCDAQVEAKVECVPAQVAVNVTGSADAEVVMAYKAGLQKHLPDILKVAVGLKDRLARVAASAQGAATAGMDVAKGLSPGVETAKLSGCVSSQLDAAVKAAGSIQANVDVSVSVSASASASAGGEASGAAGG